MRLTTEIETNILYDTLYAENALRHLAEWTLVVNNLEQILPLLCI